MSEQTGAAVTFVCFYTKDGASVTGLTVTCDVRNPAGTEVATAASATEIGDGFYSYTLAGGSTGTEGEYLAVFRTAGDVDQTDLPSLWSIGRGGVEHLDADVSSRNATTPPTVAAIRGEIDSNSTKLDAAVSSRLADADYMAPDLSDLDAAVSTRATPAQVTTAVAAVAGGGGAVAYTDTVSDDNGPLDGVQVWVTSDETGASILASTTTNGLGSFTVFLDPGSYYLWAQQSGTNFTNPTQVTVIA